MKIKQQESTKKGFIKENIKFEVYKHCLEASKFENKVNQLEKKMKLMWIVL